MKQYILKLFKTIINMIRKRYPQQRMVVDFAPDEIVSSVIFRGRFFVCTRSAVFEVFEDHEDKSFLRRKLIAHATEFSEHLSE